MRKGALLAVLVLCGCETSKYPNDPRAKGTTSDLLYKVSPVSKLNYLDYLAQYPPDKDTESFRPSINLAGESPETIWPSGESVLAKEIEDLLTPTPEEKK